MTGSQLFEVLWTFGLITGGIWGLTEILGDYVFTKRAKPLIAVLIGLVFYPSLNLVRVLVFPTELNTWEQLVASIILGAICVGASALLNDKLINPFREALRK